jgi:hypothetical protein
MVHTIFSLSSFDRPKGLRLSGWESTDFKLATLNRWLSRALMKLILGVLGRPSQSLCTIGTPGSESLNRIKQAIGRGRSEST